MIPLIFGLLVVALTVFEIIVGQVWIRIFYVWGITIYRDDNPIVYWLIVGVQGLFALGLIAGGVMGLMRH